jgi:hypothetical protein
MGWSPIRNILDPIKDVVEDVVDPVSESLASFEDGVRSVVEPVVEAADDAISNPYVRLVASIAYPPAAPYLNAYAKLDSGENLNAADIAALGVGAATDLGTLEIDPNIAKAVETGAKIADGADPIQVLASAYGEDFAKDLGLEDQVIQGLGEDTYNLVKDNIDVARVGYDIATGKDPSQVIADRFGDQIVASLGSTDPSVQALGYAGLKTAVALDQGVDQNQALLEGAKEYRTRGGELGDIDVDIDVQYPNLQEIGTVAGIDLSQFTPDISFIEDYARQVTDIDKPDLAFIEDFVRTNAPNVNIPELNFEGYKASDLGLNQLADIVNTDINLKGVDLSGIEIPDIDINLPDFDLPFIDVAQVAGLDDDIMVQQKTDDEDDLVPTAGTDIAQMLLGTDSLKNPFLRG